MRFQDLLFKTTGILFLALGIWACSDQDRGPYDTHSESAIKAYVGATIITGTDRPPIENGLLIVREDTIVGVDSRSVLDIPTDAEIVDMSGKYIMPGIINPHGHVGMADGLKTGSEVFTRENVKSQLRLYAKYGVTTVVSLGDGDFSGAGYRDSFNDREPRDLARYFLAGPVINASTPDEGRERVREHHQAGMNWIKIRIDSGLGTREKMVPEVYNAIADEAQKLGLPTAAHIVELEDAIGAAKAGFNVIAHSIRDLPVSNELLTLMRDNNIALTPTLTRELSTYVYRERPPFFDDPFFTKYADTEVMNDLLSHEMQQQFAESESGQYFEAQLPLAKENLMRTFESGVRIAMGTDSGPPARFQGYFEHLEMEMMQNAGMQPMAIIRSATSEAAFGAGISGLTGALQTGLKADFLVLSENPAEDIRNTKTIEHVFIDGVEIER